MKKDVLKKNAELKETGSFTAVIRRDGRKLLNVF
jgi:hypothetical protein